MSNLGARFRQAVAVARDEGTDSVVRKASHYLITRVVDRGTVVWLLRYTDPAKRPVRESNRVLLKAETAEQHEFLDRFRPLHPDVRRAREEAGGERWYVLDDDELGCTFWTYSNHAIVSDRPMLTLPIPAKTVQLEDAYTPARRRAHRLSAEALEKLYRVLADRDIEHVVTKIDAGNVPALHGAREYKWTEIAQVQGTRWFQRWTRWQILRSNPFYPELDQLEQLPMRSNGSRQKH